MKPTSQLRLRADQPGVRPYSSAMAETSIKVGRQRLHFPPIIPIRELPTPLSEGVLNNS